MTRAQKAEQDEAITTLRKILRPGSTVYTINVHTSRSGMMRHLRCYTIKKGEPRYISGYVARAVGMSLAVGWRGDSVKVAGCGMDVGFHLVNCLSYVLHGTKDRGADAIASNSYSFHPRPGHYRAGYSLHHEWM